MNAMIPDHEFIRGKIPMTKEEVRMITLGKMDLRPEHTLLDIGAGTGSISIQGALAVPQGKVIAIEKKAEGVELIKANSAKFQTSNVEVIHSGAMEALNKLELERVDRAFIGGSGGELKEILHWLDHHLAVDGVISLNTILLETYYEANTVLTELGYTVDVIRLHVERLSGLGNGHYLKPLNSVFIMTGKKN